MGSPQGGLSLALIRFLHVLKNNPHSFAVAIEPVVSAGVFQDTTVDGDRLWVHQQ